MSIASSQETFQKVKRAAQGGDLSLLAELYADDAEVVDFNKRNPPASPERHKGRQDIQSWLSQVPKDLKHFVSDEVIGEDRIAYTYRCEYPTGQQVVGVHVCELSDGKIRREVVAETWDD